jgi:hypothetical protein
VTLFSRTLVLVLLLGGNAQAAGLDWPLPPRGQGAEERLAVSVTNRAGLVKAPFFTTAFPEVSGFASVLTPVAAVLVSQIGWLSLRVPISFVRLDFPAKAQVSETALGNFELAVERELELRPSTRLEILAAALVPSAEHGSRGALLDNRALTLGSGVTGGKDSALLTPGVTGVRLAAHVEHWHAPFAFRAGLDVPLLVRISDASLPKEVETHAFGISPAIDLSVAAWVTSWFGGSLRGALITEPSRVQEPALERDRKQRAQVVLEPGLHFRVGRRVALALGGTVPAGGSLGGDAWSVGVQARVGF